LILGKRSTPFIGGGSCAAFVNAMQSFGTSVFVGSLLLPAQRRNSQAEGAQVAMQH